MLTRGNVRQRLGEPGPVERRTLEHDGAVEGGREARRWLLRRNGSTALSGSAR